MSLRLRLALSFSALVALIVTVLGVVLYATMQKSLEAEMDRRLDVRASQVQFVIWPGATTLTRADLTSARLDLSPLADLDAPGLYVQVLDRSGQVLATSDTLGGQALPTDGTSMQTALSGRRVLANVAVGDGRAVRVLSVPIVAQHEVLGVLQVGQSRQPLRATMAGLRALLLLLGAAAVLLSWVVGWLVAQRGLRPLRSMAQQAAAIAALRDFARHLPADSRRDEVGQLARTVNRLLSTVEDTLRRHREFVADTSHELRNPLLAMRTNLELLDRLPASDAQAECVREAREQVERMSRLVSDLLLLAQVESGQILERRPVSLGAVAERAVRSVEHRVRGQHVRLDVADDVIVEADEVRLLQVLTNLLDNALRHTPPGGAVTLTVQQRPDRVDLVVADTGVGIAPEHVPHIFERFYRADHRQGHSGRSTGLGLAIVKHLVEAHGGQISVESKPGQGSRFLIALPRYRAAVPDKAKERPPSRRPQERLIVSSSKRGMLALRSARTPHRPSQRKSAESAVDLRQNGGTTTLG